MELEPTAGSGAFAHAAAAAIAALLVLAGLVWVYRRGPKWARVLVSVALVLALLASGVGYLYILALAQAFAGP